MGEQIVVNALMDGASFFPVYLEVILPLLVPAMGGSLPNYVFTKARGIPAFVVPYANADQDNHAPNENLEIERFFLGIKTGAAMMTYIGAMK